jgi:hypothetical protein
MRAMALSLIAVVLAAPATVDCQETTDPAAGQQDLAATLGVYVFPTSDQTPQEQNADEATCYDWAVQKTGTDPFEVSKQAQADQMQASEAMNQTGQIGKGAGVHGAVGGAAVGALIGEIASDDAGSGAAWGAGIGAVHHRRKGRRAQKQAQTQVAADATVTQMGHAERLDDFNKAFSVCLEGKDYMVKY